MHDFQPYIVGISGYLGSGKTTVLRLFERNGFLGIDADAIVHELYEP
ncbi:dephospho-CoA kinase, partial [Candidatus Peregrinibacteria bacterium]|nr:dephospho-CoA kinase [Candidatus Peregrinibacteria bacterium]